MRLSFFWMVAVGCLIAGKAGAGEVEDFVDANCIDCHDVDTERGGFNIEPIYDDVAPEKRVKLLEKMREMVDTERMPPKEKEAFFSSEEVGEFIHFAESELLDYYEEEKKTRPGSSIRLRRDHYVNTIQDLLGYPLRDIEKLLPEDDLTDIHASEVTGYHLSRYIQVCRKALDYVFDREPGNGVHQRYDATDPDYQEFLAVPNKVIRSKKGFKKASRIVNDRGVLLIGNRVEKFQQFSEVSLPKPASAGGLYKITVRVSAHREKTEFRVAARFDSLSNGFGGIVGSRMLAQAVAEPGEVKELSFQAYLGEGEAVVVQKTGYTNSPHRMKDFDLNDETHKGMWVSYIEAVGPFNFDIHNQKRALLLETSEDRKGAVEVLQNFLPRAFRRPVAQEEINSFVSVYDREMKQTHDHVASLKSALTAALISTDFMYRNVGKGPMDDYEIASRLSYFLWSSMPDKRLFTLAEEGKLKDPIVRMHEVRRMLASEKAERFVEDFTNFWLELHLVGRTRPGFPISPRYDLALEEDIRSESRLFFKEVLQQNMDVTNFLDSDWTMVNEKLAQLYRLKGEPVEGIEFRRVALDPHDRRGGLIGHSSIACLTSNGTQTQPILRGVWVLENLLNQHLKVPLGVEPVETDTRGATSKLDQIRLHREAKSCQGCHQRIDPLGIALENYSVVGQLRFKYRDGNPIITTVEEYSDLDGIEGVKAFLLEQKEDFKIQLINKLKSYAYGRDTTFYDLHRTREIVEGEVHFRTLLERMVMDESFTFR